MALLAELIGGYYQFLSGTPQPSDEDVRSEFIRRRNKWMHYCRSNGLSAEAENAFTKEIKAAWEHKKTQSQAKEPPHDTQSTQSTEEG
ncbi:MAG: hypothetical protein ACRDD8_06090 [Bacteroidales bacterium]